MKIFTRVTMITMIGTAADMMADIWAVMMMAARVNINQYTTFSIQCISIEEKIYLL